MRVDVIEVAADGSAAVPTAERLRELPLHNLAALTLEDWDKVYFGAVPYLQAMRALASIRDDYGMDTGADIVAYFLANANSWRGPMARAIKAELRRRLGR